MVPSVLWASFHEGATSQTVKCKGPGARVGTEMEGTDPCQPTYGVLMKEKGGASPTSDLGPRPCLRSLEFGAERRLDLGRELTFGARTGARQVPGSFLSLL